MKPFLLRAAVVLVVVGGVAAFLVARSGDDGVADWMGCTTDRADGAQPEPAETDDAPAVAIQPVATIDEAVALADPPGDGSLLVATQAGAVLELDPASGLTTPVLDLAPLIARTGYEQGLVSVAVSVDGRSLFVQYTALDNAVVVAAYDLAAARPIDPATGRQLLHIAQPHMQHNGGTLIAAGDGSLFMSIGDGDTPEARDGIEAGFDHQRAQTLDSMHGGIFRISPLSEGDAAYAIPDANPFVGVAGAAPELWAHGLRNPWRYSFDRTTGDLWVADVGQFCWEEISVVPAGAVGPAGAGTNFGWSRYEGDHLFLGDELADATFPVLTYRRDEARCAVVGGYVYRGSAIPELSGSYVFGDFCDGRVRFLRPAGDGWEVGVLAATVPGLVSFGEDAAGELYTLSLTAGVGRLTAG